LDRLVSPYHPGHASAGLPHRGPPACPPSRQKGAVSQQEGVALLTAADLLPLTVPEVRRLLWALVWHTPPPAEQVLRWSTWRRHHQARAKQSHIKRRQQRLQVTLKY
jgi:hypothetical protein